MTSLFVSSRNAGNLKPFWFQVHTSEENQSKSKVTTFKFPRTENSNESGLLLKVKGTALRPRSIRAFVENTLPETASNKMLQSRVLLGPSFKLRQLSQ